MKMYMEYAIRINIPDLGDFYLSRIDNNYCNVTKYFFTQDLNRVVKWKTIKIIDTTISNIIKYNSIYLMFDADPKKIYSEDIISNYEILYNNNKFRIKIDSIVEKGTKEKIKTEIEILETDLLCNIDNLKSYILKYDDVNLKKFEKKFRQFRQLNYKYNSNKSNNCIDFVNASHNFRILKLQYIEKMTENETGV